MITWKEEKDSRGIKKVIVNGQVIERKVYKARCFGLDKNSGDWVSVAKNTMWKEPNGQVRCPDIVDRGTWGEVFGYWYMEQPPVASSLESFFTEPNVETKELHWGEIKMKENKNGRCVYHAIIYGLNKKYPDWIGCASKVVGKVPNEDKPRVPDLVQRDLITSYIWGNWFQ